MRCQQLTSFFVMDLLVNKDFVNCLENMMWVRGGIKWSFSIYPELTLLWIVHPVLGMLKHNLMFKSKTRHLQNLHLNPILHTTSSFCVKKCPSFKKYYYKKFGASKIISLFSKMDKTIILVTRLFQQDWYSRDINNNIGTALCCQLCYNLV